MAYQEVLILRVFNAGRTPDSIEHIVLGGRRGGRGGLDLSDYLELPLRLEPGESKRWRLDPRVSPLSKEWPTVCAGWTSLWLLMGSMRQRRVEVLPIPEKHPPVVGWRLVPRRTKLARYLPLAVGLPVAVWATTPGTGPLEIGLVTGLGVFVAGRALWVLGSSHAFRRRRVERWALAAGWFLSLAEMARTSSSRTGDQLPTVDVVLLGIFLLVALVLAIPGAAVDVAATRRLLRDRLAQASGRLRGSSLEPQSARTHPNSGGKPVLWRLVRMAPGARSRHGRRCNRQSCGL